MSKRNSHLTTIVTTMSAVAVIATATLAGFSGWSIPAAFANPVAPILGVDADTAVVIAPVVSTADKFEPSAYRIPGQALVATATALGVMSPQSQEATAAKSTPIIPTVRTKKSVKAIDRTPAKKIKWKKARVSWYGPGLYGNGMAGGGKLKRNSMIVAHRSLPFGTKILFKYKGRTVVATVKDRGPFIRGRVFDLGPGTARALKFSGVGTVKYSIIKKGRR